MSDTPPETPEPGRPGADPPHEGSVWEGFGTQTADDARRLSGTMPSLVRVPAWLWRKVPRGGQFLLAVAALVALGFGLRAIPGIEDGKVQERARNAQLDAISRRATARDQRPTVVAVAKGRATVAGLERAVAAGVPRLRARGLIPGPVDSVRCVPTGLIRGARAVSACEARVGSSAYAIVGVTDTARDTVAYCFRRIPAEQSLDVPLEPACSA